MLASIPRRPLEAADVALSIAPLHQIALACAYELLSEAELARVQRITHQDYRLQVVKARALLRLMLAWCTGEPPRSFEFDEGGGTRPQLRANPWGLQFSVSHSDEQVAIAVSTAQVGIDIERVEADSSCEEIASVCFHPSEQARLECATDLAAPETFFEIWTKKEAYLKAIGTGLDTDPASFSTAAPDCAVSAELGGRRGGTTYTRAIDAPAGYKAALAGPWPQPRLMYCRLDGELPIVLSRS